MSQLNLTLMLSSMADWSSNSVAAGGAPPGHHPSNTAVISSGNYPQTTFQTGSSSYQSPNHNPHHQNAHASSSYYSQLMDLLQRYNQSRNFSTSAGGTGSGGSGSGSFLNFSQIDLLNELLTNRGNGNHSSISSFTGGAADAAQLGQLHLLTNSVVKGGSANFEEEDFENSSSSSGDVLPTVRILLCVIYAAICLLGVAGNGLVFFSVARNPAMHSVTNVFISNLAFSDILLSLFAVPITPLYLLVYRAWHFGAVLCHLLPFAQGASIYISAFTLMSIAIDRYQVIMYPLRARMKMNVCIGIILAIWLVTAVITSPYAYYMKLVEIGGSGSGGGGGGEEFVVERGDPLLETEVETETDVMEVTEPIVLYCDEQWPGDSVRLSYTVLTSILQFVVPLLIIGFCYTKVCGKLWDRTKSIPGSVSARREEQERERARRTNTMLICMVVCFVLSWAGLNIYNLLMDFVKLQHNTTAFLVLHVIAMSSVIYNPILYGVLNENFRKEFKAILPCLAALFTSSSSSASELHPAHGNHHHPNDASSRRRSSYNTTAAAAAASASVSNNNNNNNNNISTSSTNANANASLHNNSYNSSKRCVKLHLSAKKEEEEEASISGTSCSGGKMAADKSSLISSEQMMQEPRAHHLGTTVVTTTAAAAAATKATRRADSPPANLRVNGDNRRADIGYYSCDGRLVANGKPPPLTELS